MLYPPTYVKEKNRPRLSRSRNRFSLVHRQKVFPHGTQTHTELCSDMTQPLLRTTRYFFPFEDWLNQGCKDFISSNLKTRGDRRMSRSKFQTDSPQIFGVTVTNRSPQRTCASDLCIPGLDCSEGYRLVPPRPSGKDTPGTWYSVET